ncbi:OmpH family outer membrane protein [Tabrizicola sp. YIM 78059]|uniref:OmpH family outer membrane protein n=1 Tax=Tabrizicola sp. YIM 78059 TaxID=2529861 RepID=UPI0010AB1A96|nr:OmpH family outer membrane protein [Tabrizicola sp. YIM 78059]
MRAWRALCAVVVLLFLGQPVPAQDAPIPGGIILTLDQDRLFLDSAYGKASVERERAATKALEAENARIEAELVAEEQELTRKRGTLPAEEFSALAAEFDAKVERIRAEQDEKSRDLVRAREADRQAFLRAAIPALAELMGELGAVAILDKSQVFLSLSAIDVTDEAIVKVDAVLPAETAP